jgi:hypothetical protein
MHVLTPLKPHYCCCAPAVGPSGQPGKPGPPIFLSYPHYCGADPSLARGVEGLACDPPAHDLFVDVGKPLALPCSASAREPRFMGACSGL